MTEENRKNEKKKRVSLDTKFRVPSQRNHTLDFAFLSITEATCSARPSLYFPYKVIKPFCTKPGMAYFAIQMECFDSATQKQQFVLYILPSARVIIDGDIAQLEQHFLIAYMALAVRGECRLIFDGSIKKQAAGLLVWVVIDKECVRIRSVLGIIDFHKG